MYLFAVNAHFYSLHTQLLTLDCKNLPGCHRIIVCEGNMRHKTYRNNKTYNLHIISNNKYN